MESVCNTEVELRAEVARLRGILAGTSSDIPPDWSLTQTEDSVFRALLSHDVVPTDLIVEVAETTAASARVHVHRLRLKVSPHGIEIETVVGKGWRLIGREQWRAFLATKQEGVQ